MTLTPGSRLGPYEVLGLLGSGGMGEVYRARDPKLRREVAVKVLPASFSADPERLARFEREAQLLASLNHANVGAIHGFEEAEGIRYLVLELVAGETLAERLAAGPLRVEEALPIFRQIAEALEAAHEKGVVHRDLKPSNIKVTPEGTVKVLDFGLAKSLGAETSGSDASHSPTVTSEGTRGGVILGTAAYMSPEQARGKPLDKRTDIWSFGCVLYEALTGRQAFSGETVSDTIAAILGREPDWGALPETTPAGLRVLLRRCLEKSSRRRLHDIADARIEIEEVPAGPEEIRAGAIGAAQSPRWRRALPWSLCTLLAVVAAVTAGALWRATRLQPARMTRFVIDLPPAEPLALADLGSRPALALSPDGGRLVYVAARDGRSKLYVRAMDQVEARPIPGTEGGDGPFFSPDGQWLGFFTSGELKKAPLAGGAPQALCEVPPVTRGASWGSDGTILFTLHQASGLSQVPAGGGKVRNVTVPDPAKGERAHLWPEILPGGKAVLFTVATGGSFEEARIEVLTLSTGERKTLVKGGTNAHYTPTGHLVYAHAGGLYAVPFDLTRLEVTGAPILIREGVLVDARTGAAQFTLSSDGSLAYVPGAAQVIERTLLWVDRRGVAQPLAETRGAFSYPALSPDGRRLALAVQGAKQDVWVYELARGTLTRLTFDASENWGPIWTPDSKRLTFNFHGPGVPNLIWKPADGSGTAERLTTSENPQFVNSWSPDGQVLAFTEQPPSGTADIWLLPLQGDRKPRPFLRTPFDEYGAAFAPDGHWLAYVSNASGRPEVYVRPFPGPGGEQQISTEGGGGPVWARNGREIFYRNGDKMMAAAVDAGPIFNAGKPRLLFQGRHEEPSEPHWPRNYDVSPDGQRFLMIRMNEPRSAPTRLHVVLNWFEELKQRVPSG